MIDKSIEKFVNDLSEEENEIVIALRQIVLEVAPEIREKLSYGVPYYSLNKRVCFIWPGSVKWQGTSHRGVKFGFCRGDLIRDESNYFDLGSRKYVSTRVYHDVSDIDEDLLKTYVYEAIKNDIQL